MKMMHSELLDELNPTEEDILLQEEQMELTPVTYSENAKHWNMISG